MLLQPAIAHCIAERLGSNIFLYFVPTILVLFLSSWNSNIVLIPKLNQHIVKDYTSGQPLRASFVIFVRSNIDRDIVQRAKARLDDAVCMLYFDPSSALGDVELSIVLQFSFFSFVRRDSERFFLETQVDEDVFLLLLEKSPRVKGK